MKPENYDAIPLLPEKTEETFMHMPGIYCRNCGQSFALYWYSAQQPSGVDENKKPYYNTCFKCDLSELKVFG